MLLFGGPPTSAQRRGRPRPQTSGADEARKGADETKVARRASDASRTMFTIYVYIYIYIYIYAYTYVPIPSPGPRLGAAVR